MSHWAVITAAGAGRRMGSATPKQYLPLAGKTVLEHSLQLFSQHPAIDGLMVVLSPNDTRWPALNFSCDKPLLTVEGGAERADSVLAGLQALKQYLHEDDWVLIHDAARACLSRNLLDRLINELAEDACGGLLALPARDTLKHAANGQVQTTLDRSQIWQAQTPQMFRYGLLVSALQLGLASGKAITDESMAIEHQGHRPRLVEGSPTNIKITTEDDLALAAFLLSDNQQKQSNG